MVCLTLRCKDRQVLQEDEDQEEVIDSLLMVGGGHMASSNQEEEECPPPLPFSLLPHRLQSTLTSIDLIVRQVIPNTETAELYRGDIQSDR